jgi:CHAT domain-containing protein
VQEAAPIHDDVIALRRALRDRDNRQIKELARRLDDKVMKPIRQLLGQTRTVLLSPDGELNLIPFGALVDEQGRYLIETYSFIYLTSGRDLLRLPNSFPGKQSRNEAGKRKSDKAIADQACALILAAPDFGERTSQVIEPSPEQAGPLSLWDLSSLPGTAGQAQALSKLLLCATVLTKKKATETALKQAVGPAIVHVATHGFFADPTLASSAERYRDDVMGLRLSGDIEPLRASRLLDQIKDPLVRSGLVLAGANRPHSGGDDGILTALEAMSLNLWGTKLVVLSACDTGVGEVKTGDGVYGLRRALVLAGSESQVMSLWKVSDKATQDLMIAYYRALRAGKGRSEALRQVQLQMLSSKNWWHPYYWAGFIQSGHWTSIEGITQKPAVRSKRRIR